MNSLSGETGRARLLFGRFLQEFTTVNCPKSLTERRFRSYWERTGNGLSFWREETSSFPAAARAIGPTDAEVTPDV